jgi:parvulin-like peptidyl-prolyl isomerase
VGNVSCLNFIFLREGSELAGKHRKEKIERAPTKHQLSRWEKQKKLSRIILICTVALVIILAGVIGGGIYLDQVAPMKAVVLKVNDVPYDFDYYVKMLDVLTKGQTDTSMLKYYVDVVANIIQQGEVVKEKAGDVGITVTDDEITKELDTSKLPKSNVTIDLVRTRLITQKYMQQQCLPKQPKSVEQAETQAMLLETSFMAADRKQKLLLGENFTKMAASLSIDSYTQNKKGYLGWIPKGYEGVALGTLNTSAIKDVIFKLAPNEISDPVYDANIGKPFGYWVLQVLEKDATKGIHARGILFGLKDDADAVRAKLIAGASWNDMAKQYSQDSSKDTGGDLGWKVPGMEKGMLDRILSSQETTKISDVIRDDSIGTKGGYWVVQVLNRQERPLDATVSQTLSENCLTTWVDGLMESAKTENLLDQKQKDLAVQKVIKLRSK